MCQVVKDDQVWSKMEHLNSERDPKHTGRNGANEELVLDLKIVLKKDEINKHGVVNHNRP